MKDKNFGITESDFLKMTKELQNGNEEIFEHIFLSHFEKCMKYLKQSCTITHEEAYDACMETLIEFRKGLINDKYTYGNLNYLFTKMATQRFFKNCKKKINYVQIDKMKDMLEDPITMDADELVVLDRAWSKLGENCKTLLKKFYYDNQKLKEMAEKESRKPASLRKQKERCMNALRINFQSIVNV